MPFDEKSWLKAADAVMADDAAKEAALAASYKEKAGSDNIEELDSWVEIAKVLAICQATSMDVGAYLVIQRKLREAVRAVYAEGFDDGFHLAQEDE